VQHYNIHAIKRLLLRFPSFNSSTVNFRSHSAHFGRFFCSLRSCFRAEFPDLCFEKLKTLPVLLQNVVRNVYFTLNKCDSPSLILREFLDGLLLGFRQVTFQFQPIASGFCCSHSVRMTPVCVSSTRIVVICVALKPSVYYVLRVVTVKSSSFLTQCMCFARVTDINR
jgi:hypothetical protein